MKASWDLAAAEVACCPVALASDALPPELGALALPQAPEHSYLHLPARRKKAHVLGRGSGTVLRMLKTGWQRLALTQTGRWLNPVLDLFLTRIGWA